MINRRVLKALKEYTCSVDDGFVTQCGHGFHKHCLIKSLMINNTDCPLCRYNLVFKKAANG